VNLVLTNKIGFGIKMQLVAILNKTW